MNIPRRRRDPFYPTLAAGAPAIVTLCAFAPAGPAPASAAFVPPPVVASMGPRALEATATPVAADDDAALMAMSIANHDR